MKFSLMTLPMFFRCFINYYMTKDKEDYCENYEEMLDYVREAGIESVDVTSREIDSLGAEYISGQLKKRGVSVSSVLFQKDFPLLNSTYDEMQKVISRGVGDVKTLGCKIMMLIPEAPDGIDADKSAEVKENLIKTFTFATELAAKSGITTVIEDTPNLALNLCTSAQLEEMLDAVKGLKMVYDSGNMLLVNEDPVVYYEKFKGRIGYIHLKDMRLANAGDRRPDVSVSGVKMTGAFSGTGMVDFGSLIKAIIKSGYDGGMTIELAYKDGMKFPDSLKEAKNYFENIIKAYV